MLHREKLRDARTQLTRVAQAERDYLDGSPYRLVHRYDPRGGGYTIQAEIQCELPAELPTLVADVLASAAAGLDALAAALASSPADAPSSPRFPIHDSLPVFAQRSRRPLAAMPAEAQATIETLQPYHTFGGFRHDVLWRLRELRGDGGARLAAGSLRDDSALGVNTQRHVELAGDLHVVPGPFERGDAIVSVPARVTGPDPKLDLFLRPAWELAFAASGPARGASLLSTLGAICDHVDRVVFAALEPYLDAGLSS
jgi:hypothetical protein